VGGSRKRKVVLAQCIEAERQMLRADATIARHEARGFRKRLLWGLALLRYRSAMLAGIKLAQHARRGHGRKRLLLPLLEGLLRVRLLCGRRG